MAAKEKHATKTPHTAGRACVLPLPDGAAAARPIVFVSNPAWESVQNRGRLSLYHPSQIKEWLLKWEGVIEGELLAGRIEPAQADRERLLFAEAAEDQIKELGGPDLRAPLRFPGGKGKTWAERRRRGMETWLGPVALIDGIDTRVYAKAWLLRRAAVLKWCDAAQSKRRLGPTEPTDLIRLHVVESRYKVSRETVRRYIRKGMIHDYRPGGHATTTQVMVSEREIADHFSPRR